MYFETRGCVCTCTFHCFLGNAQRVHFCFRALRCRVLYTPLLEGLSTTKA
jgi:hypothetical protein